VDNSRHVANGLAGTERPRGNGHQSGGEREGEFRQQIMLVLTINTSVVI